MRVVTNDKAWHPVSHTSKLRTGCLSGQKKKCWLPKHPILLKQFCCELNYQFNRLQKNPTEEKSKKEVHKSLFLIFLKSIIKSGKGALKKF